MPKKFINKKKARSYKVSPSFDGKNDFENTTPCELTSKGQNFTSCEIFEQIIKDPLSNNLINPSLKEARNYGIEFDDADDYDYLRHMKEISPNLFFFENPIYHSQLQTEKDESVTNQEVVDVLQELEEFDSNSPAKTGKYKDAEKICSFLLKNADTTKKKPHIPNESLDFQLAKNSLGIEGKLPQNSEPLQMSSNTLEKILEEYSSEELVLVKVGGSTQSSCIDFGNLLEDINKYL